jgi:phosphoglycolate phosphatase-like HAD superfamily hydrolase
MTITHVLFDFDGTLVDSRSAILAGYRHAVAEVLGIDDFPGPDEDVGELLKRRLPETFALLGAPDRGDEGARAYDDWYRANGTPMVAIYDGVHELLDGLDAAGVAYGIVTNKARGRTEGDLRHVGLDPARFAVLVTAEDSAERKPDPTPLRIGAERAGAAPGATVYVGDGPHDVEASNAAGLGAIGVSWGFYERAELEAAGAAYVADDTGALLAHVTARAAA